MLWQTPTTDILSTDIEMVDENCVWLRRALELGRRADYRRAMAKSETPDPILAAAKGEGPSEAVEDTAIGQIAQRLKKPISNRVTRARQWVEREVPPSQRGPGWDRHWRELEAYYESLGRWSVPSK